jgi:hypothetical protein
MSHTSCLLVDDDRSRDYKHYSDATPKTQLPEREGEIPVTLADHGEVSAIEEAHHCLGGSVGNSSSGTNSHRQSSYGIFRKRGSEWPRSTSFRTMRSPKVNVPLVLNDL